MKPPLRNGSPDDFSTPPAALNPLLKYIPMEWTIWDPAIGIGGDMTALADALQNNGYKVVTTKGSFSIFRPPEEEFDCIITNPPYSNKEGFLKTCYLYEKPFALLMPITALEGRERQSMYREFGIQLILFDRRINFIPNRSGAWFAVGWFTWKLGLKRDIIFETL